MLHARAQLAACLLAACAGSAGGPDACAGGVDDGDRCTVDACDPATVFHYAWRMSADAAATWTACGISGPWGSPADSGVLTVTP